MSKGKPSRRWSRRALLLAGVLSFGLLSSQADGQTQGKAQPSSGAGRAKAPAANDQAVAALERMAAALASAKTMRFKIRNLVPMKGPSGSWITLVGAATVMREGDHKLSVETGGDFFPFRLYFDGKTVTAFAPKENVYATKDAPGTIDQVLDQAAKNGEATFVFAPLVSPDPLAAMTKGLKTALVVGTSTLEGVETQHLAIHGDTTDWEVWIGTKDRLPRMVTLTDLSDARKPTHTLFFSDWELDVSLPADAFSFNAPADAMKVPFRNPGQQAAARRGVPQDKRP